MTPRRAASFRFLALAAALIVLVLLAARSSSPPVSLSQPLPSTLTEILDRRGDRIALVRHGDILRQSISAAEIDRRLITSTLSAEDRRFFAHPGIDPLALARAAWQNTTSRRIVSGGSTLTQQVCHLARGGTRDSSRLFAKLRESWEALVLEAHYSKSQILTAYLDRAPYGPAIEGAQAASRLYFGHGVEALSWEEAALLAAMPQAPTRLDPRRHPEAAKRARDRVIARLPLPEAERVELASRPLVIRTESPVTPRSTDCPHWIQAAMNAWPEASEIRLPIDETIQRSAVAAVTGGLRELQGRGVDAAAAIVLDTRSGEVRAWVGSPEFDDPSHGQFDGASARRQPGSALKPFAYALAFERGLRPSSLLPDLPSAYGGEEGVFAPGNYANTWRGPVRARVALANSWNAPAVALLDRLGPEAFLDRLHGLGLTSLSAAPSTYGLGLILGVGEVSLRDLTSAYATLGRGGRAKGRVDVLSVGDGTRELMSERASITGRAERADEDIGARRGFTSEAAFLVNATLADPRARAVAFGRDGPFDFEFPVAIKTGTSSDWRDNWAFAYDDRWTVGVWVGRADGEPMDRVSGSEGAILILRRLLPPLFADDPSDSLRWNRARLFPRPIASMEKRSICPLSGEAATDACAGRLEEWFPRDDRALPNCRWHRRVTVDRVTGMLARGCTPESRRENRVVTEPPISQAELVTSEVFSAVDAWPVSLWRRWARDEQWAEGARVLGACVCGEAGCGGVDPVESPFLAASVGREGTAWVGDDRPRAGRGRGEAVDGVGHALRVTHPIHGSIYAIDPSLSRGQQAVALEASSGRPSTLRWSVDGLLLGESAPGERLFWPLEVGRHRIAVESSGERNEVVIEVEGE